MMYQINTTHNNPTTTTQRNNTTHNNTNVMADIPDDEISYDSDSNQRRNVATDVVDTVNDVIIDDDTLASSDEKASTGIRGR
jgi:hypothetical protein